MKQDGLNKTLAAMLLLCMSVMNECHNGTGLPFFPYLPEVTFTGFINGDYDSLTGNRTWPNTCRLVGDTVRIVCYSSTFSEANRIRHGDLIRLDLLPDSADGFQKRNVMFHLARYYDDNESYTINKGDSIDISIRFESEIVSFVRTTGASVELDKIYIETPPVKNGQYLMIDHGHLFGSICSP
jgi:hypothetical protein